MTNSDVVSGWVNAMDMCYGYSPKALCSNSLHVDGIFLVSYATPIAKYENGKFKLIGRKFRTYDFKASESCQALCLKR